MPKDLRNLLVYRIHDAALVERARRHFRGRLVDIGCGSKPYLDPLAPFVAEHVGVDRAETLHDASRIDRLGTAYAIPAPDREFDCALCTAVLEHLEEPERALSECYRVLKPGGVAIYTVPFIWHVHEAPRDFYRFTRYGLAYLFEKTGFEVVELQALSGFWVTFGQLLVYNLYRLNRGPLRWLGLVAGLGLAIQLGAYLLDRLDRTEQWTWSYLAVVRKPAGSGA